MSDLFKIIAKLDEMKLDYCIQRSAQHSFYSMALDTPRGSRKHLHSNDIKTLEKELKLIWGHLLESKKIAPVMPLPPMPLPGQ